MYQEYPKYNAPKINAFTGMNHTSKVLSGLIKMLANTTADTAPEAPTAL
jgi:hypothetical protein